MQTSVIPVPDGAPIAVQESGSPHGPPLLLLAGQANSHVWWDGLRTSFDDAFRVLTLDWRGTGGSRGEIGRWSTESFAADVAAVVDAVVGGPVAVYGTSMGGRVAQVLAARRPDLVARLVLACTSPGGRHALERGPDVRRSLADADPGRRRAALRELFFTPAHPDTPDDDRLLGDPTMSAAERRAHLRASDGHDAWDLLPLVGAPTLVLHGEDDRMTPVGNARVLAGRLPDAEVAVLPGRHGFFVEHGRTVTPVVRDFLLPRVDPREPAPRTVDPRPGR